MPVNRPSFGQRAHAYRSGNQAITTGTVTEILFDLEYYDTDNMHSTVSNTTRMTAQSPGLYVIGASVGWADSSAGRRYTYLRLNGTTNIVEVGGPPHANACSQNASGLYYMQSGDYFEVRVYQDTGYALNVQAAQFWIAKIQN